MATITYDAESPGKAAERPVKSRSPRRQILLTGSYAFDNSYPTGGEDISDIFNQFSSLLGLVIEHPFFSAGTGKWVRIDYTAKKAMLFTNAATPAEVANASDQSGATGLRFVAWGYA